MKVEKKHTKINANKQTNQNRTLCTSQTINIVEGRKGWFV